MSARIKFVRGRWQRIEPPAETVSGRLIDVIHHLNARLTAVEQAIAANSAPAPKRCRTKKSA
jgi:hypothetical protein